MKYKIASAKPKTVWTALTKGDFKKAAESLWDMVRPRPQTWTSFKEEFYTLPESTADVRAYLPKYGKNGTVLPDLEKEMVKLVNQERKKAGLKPLQVDPRLTALAEKKAADMALKEYFSHKSPTYGFPEDMVTNAGITWRMCGENLARNRTVEDAHKALMNSEGHRANILRPEFTHIGIGVVASDTYGLLVTEIFIQAK